MKDSTKCEPVLSIHPDELRSTTLPKSALSERPFLLQIFRLFIDGREHLRSVYQGIKHRMPSMNCAQLLLV